MHTLSEIGQIAVTVSDVETALPFYRDVLGLPLLFFLMISGGDVELFFAQLANFVDRFLGADPDRQVGFVNELKFGLIGLATLVACLRLPGFLCEVNEGLREERP